MAKSGLQTDQILNKACLASFTGDWSTFTESMLTEIDENEVDPVFGPLFPTSRLGPYNPITGELQVEYRFTHGVLSGGQAIKSKVELICDPSASNGEYCPASMVTTDKVSGKTISTLSVSKDGSAQKTIVLTDEGADYWYNKMKVTHTYTLKGKTVTKEIEEAIIHKGDMFVECGIGIGPGIGGTLGCKPLFSEDALLSRYRIKSATMVPSTAIYYQGDTVKTNVNYDAIGEGSETGFGLHYLVQCRSTGNTITDAIGKVDVTASSALAATSTGTSTTTTDSTAATRYGEQVVSLFTIPQFGGDAGGDNSYATMRGNAAANIDLNPTETKYVAIRFTNKEIDKIKDIKVEVKSSDGYKVLGTNPILLNFQSKTDIEHYYLPLEITSKIGLEDISIRLYEAEYEIAASLYECTKTVESECIDSSKNVVLGNYEVNTRASFNSAKSQTGEIDTSVLSGLQPGSCTMYLKAMKLSQPSFATAEDFKAASAYEDATTQTNVDQNDGYGPVKFTIASDRDKPDTTTNPKSTSIDILYPTSTQSYCLNGNKWDETPKITIASNDVVPSRTYIEYYFVGAGVNNIDINNADSISGIAMSSFTEQTGSSGYYYQDLKFKDNTINSIVEYFEENTLARLEFDMTIKVVSKEGTSTDSTNTDELSVTDDEGKSTNPVIIKEEKRTIYISKCGN